MSTEIAMLQTNVTAKHSTVYRHLHEVVEQRDRAISALLPSRM